MRFNDILKALNESQNLSEQKLAEYNGLFRQKKEAPVMEAQQTVNVEDEDPEEGITWLTSFADERDAKFYLKMREIVYSTGRSAGDHSFRYVKTQAKNVVPAGFFADDYDMLDMTIEQINAATDGQADEMSVDAIQMINENFSQEVEIDDMEESMYDMTSFSDPSAFL